jgi:hypothetical protein
MQVGEPMNIMGQGRKVDIGTPRCLKRLKDRSGHARQACNVAEVLKPTSGQGGLDRRIKYIGGCGRDEPTGEAGCYKWKREYFAANASLARGRRSLHPHRQWAVHHQRRSAYDHSLRHLGPAFFNQFETAIPNVITCG